MGHPSKDLTETEGTLRTVIETLNDDQEGFQKIGEAIEDESFKRYFLAESLKRAEFRGELESILHREGVRDIGETGTPEGAFRRLFTGLKSVFGAGTHALLKSAEEAEDAAREAYANALEKFLPAPVREVLIRQAAHIEASHAYVKTARSGNQ